MVTTPPFRFVAERDFLLTHSDPGICPRVYAPSDLPGIVIFLHGVNDPGGNYDAIEMGICEGLNERLDAFRLTPGSYGQAFAQARKSKITPDQKGYADVVKIKYDPDTFMYQRSEVEGEVGTRTHSVFIPFYWGYRASEEEIAQEPPKKDGTSGGYKTVRGQYQDKHGNRLSKHFAKGGGTFNNATTSIPLMFGEGFYSSAGNRTAKKVGVFDQYQFSGESPHRRYMVLAAERLAMLVREIRTRYANDTVTIIGHSQGTMVALLAQAMLADGNPGQTVGRQASVALPPVRRADTLILVDSPYSLREPALETIAQPRRPRYSARGKINTLVNIVQSVTATPHARPPLTDLSPSQNTCGHEGRAGKAWHGVGHAIRRERDGTLTPFVERDNRGKVYMYFCPEDGTVSPSPIAGIGAQGVPDHIPLGTVRKVGHFFGSGVQDKYPAMVTLAQERFFQRAWSRRAKDKEGRDTAVGQPAGHRLRFAGWECQINAEAIEPPHVPAMYTGETIRGDEKTEGLMIPDDYAKDLAIGNPDEHMPMVELSRAIAMGPSDPQAVMDAFNEGKDPDDRTYSVRVNRRREVSATEAVYITMREETPNETRQRIQSTQTMWQKNSYHSAILADMNNLRRVAALDVSVGQARAIDDLDWRRLFIALADWKMDEDATEALKKNPCFSMLSTPMQSLTRACITYYQEGEFPSAHVRTDVPSLIDAETR
jgi:pimeloyl-ACP methyl ester carboxylesterase